MKTIILFLFAFSTYAQTYNVTLIEQRTNEKWLVVPGAASVKITEDKITINNVTYNVVKVTPMPDKSFIYDCSTSSNKCHFLLVNGLLFQYIDKLHFLYHLKK
ncbi:hypothetical protein [Flavobacterium capsici]|uniref:Uncharacterized protein n=1 Tax=Flavobacterium capsici TaxID=3075618 RepID=A0AA96EW30_9FLAO|nr:MULTISPECIES: hypothetical protein [unclassified Flavobacterium]WNM19251.1 hypothetical protein RN608_00880 [Flavobacterium sp. PMR2A8]WNM20640.1 hypothetical protein RN605_08050 [Flavobacterium sp. PMTSA4]